jgi:signal transduction histidine kinase
MRRGAIVLVLVGVVLLLGSYLVYTQRVVTTLRHEAGVSSQMYGEIYRALSDTAGDPTAVLFDLATRIRESGVPMIVTDRDGRPQFTANLPGVDSTVDVRTDPRVRAWISRLDAANPPVVQANGATVHFGHSPLVQSLRVVPVLQVGMLAFLLLFGVFALRTRARAYRERVWAGMARESAHQLGTPISSLSGWIELLRERQPDALPDQAIAHMAGDVERLERVAHRFERIGRPPQRETVDLAALVDRVADYFAARVPTLAHTVQISREFDARPLEVRGDPVLIEWAVEALVRNAVDALGGRGGSIRIEGSRLPEGGARVSVADDGPGVPRELRRRIFEAGFSTKDRGWGVGLALAKRIVEEAHGGALALATSDRGATFEIIFPG